MDKNKAEVVKLLIVGDQAVGKTSILYRFTDNSFQINMVGTTGIDFKKKMIEVGDKTYKILLYDTAGHERFRHITASHYKGVKGVILAYDVTERNSFTNSEQWLEDIKEKTSKDVKICMMANKIDMENRVVTQEEGKQLAEKFKVDFYEVSAKEDINIAESFNQYIYSILPNEKKEESSEEEPIEKLKEIETKPVEEVKPSEPTSIDKKEKSKTCCAI